MTDDTQWTDWIEHKAGDPCPIPDARGGDYEIKWADGVVEIYVGLFARHVCGWDSNAVSAYRLRKPPVDWKGIADELAKSLEVIGFRSLASGAELNAAYAALTRYREAIK